MTELTISNVQPAVNMELAEGLNDIKSKIYQAAQSNLAEVGDGFTDIEQTAMLHVEALRQTNGLELATVLIRGEIIDVIVGDNLTTQHPNQYESLREMARDQGLSHSELSKTQTLVHIIFPFLRDELDMNIAQVWEQVGKSKLTDLIPYLRVLITGEESNSDRVNGTIEVLTEETVATAEEAGRDLTDDQLRDVMVQGLIEDGSNLPTRRLRERLRPERTPAIETVYLKDRDRTLVIAELSPDQVDMFEQRMHRHTDPQVITLPDDPRTRAFEAAQVPLVQRIAELISAQE